MIRVTHSDFKKLLDFLKKEGQDGATLTFKEEGSALTITTFDRNNKQMVIELSDVDYNFMPRVTKTETI